MIFPARNLHLFWGFSMAMLVITRWYITMISLYPSQPGQVSSAKGQQTRQVAVHQGCCTNDAPGPWASAKAAIFGDDLGMVHEVYDIGFYQIKSEVVVLELFSLFQFSSFNRFALFCAVDATISVLLCPLRV